MALRGFLAFKCFRWGIAYQHRGAGGTHTRRYSGMLAVYHRGLGEVAAIPATGTRTTGAVCAPACRGGRAIRRPLQPDTGRPIRPIQNGGTRELIFRGCLPPYARARVGPTNPTYPKSVQAALQRSVQGGFTGTHTTTRTATQTATLTRAGTGTGAVHGPHEGHEGRGHTPAGVRPGCVTAQDSQKPPQERAGAVFRGSPGVGTGEGGFDASTRLSEAYTRSRPCGTSPRRQAAWRGRLAPARATARARPRSRERA